MTANFSTTRKREIATKIEQLADQVREGLQAAQDSFEPEQIWSEYLKITEFQLTLWTSTRICYGAIYYAYENFIDRCIAVGRKDPNYRSLNIGTLRSDFTAIFGSALGNDCLDHREVRIAITARNCLVHRGGRVSKEFTDLKPRLKVENGIIQIMPEDVESLFDLLKRRAKTVIESATKLPMFAL